jgi:hypothetical protein
MILEYLDFEKKGTKTIEHYTGTGIVYFRFSPKGEVPDDLGLKILEKFKLEFKEEGKPAWSPPPVNRLLCDICGFEGSNIKSITMHKSIKHKEKKK